MVKYHEVSITAGGAFCYSDAAILDSSYLYLASLFGRPAAVKAIAAGIISGKSIRLGDTSADRPSGKMRIVSQGFEDGISHRIVFCPEYFTGRDVRILVSEDKKRAFDFLDTQVSTPLKEEWADWLWERVFTPLPLIGFGVVNGKDLQESYLVRLDKTPEEIDELVLEGLRTGELN